MKGFDYILDNQENDHLTLYENIFRLNRGKTYLFRWLTQNKYIPQISKPEYIELESDLEYSELFENLLKE